MKLACVQQNCHALGAVRAWPWLAVGALILLSDVRRAAAQAPQQLPTTVLYSTQGAPLGSPVDSVLQAALEDLGVVEIVARPGMDLGAVQLALDCVAETIRCLRIATEQSHAELLIAPSLQRTPSEVVLSVLRFDARGGGKMRRVLRRQSGQVLGAELLDQVPSMMRELFDLPPATKPPPAAPAVAVVPLSAANPASPPAAAQEAPAPASTPLPEGPMEPPTSHWRVPVAPLILGGVGVLTLAGGIVAGAMMQSTHSQYERLVVETKQDAQQADDLRSTGRTQATVANVLFGVGGAAVLAAGIWLLVDHQLASRREVALTMTSELQPLLGPQQLGLVFTHRGNAL